MKGQTLLGTLIFFSSVSSVAQPTITSFTPTSGPVGTFVTINGSGFSATPASNKVYFGAMKAAVTAATSTQLTVTVPLGATYQPIRVQSSGLTGYSTVPFATTYIGWGLIDANSFSPKVDRATGSNPNFSAVGDFDGDGLTDLAVTTATSFTVSVYRNAGGGTGVASYPSKVDLALPFSPNGVTVGLTRPGMMAFVEAVP